MQNGIQVAVDVISFLQEAFGIANDHNQSRNDQEFTKPDGEYVSSVPGRVDNAQVGTSGSLHNDEVKVPVEGDPQNSRSHMREEQVKVHSEETMHSNTIDQAQEHEPAVGGEPHTGHEREDEKEIEDTSAVCEPPTEEDVDRWETGESDQTTAVDVCICPNELCMEADVELSGDDVANKSKRKVQNNRKKYKKPDSRMRKKGKIPVRIVEESDDECDNHRDLEQQEAVPKTKRVRLTNKRNITLDYLYVSTSTSSQSEDDPE